MMNFKKLFLLLFMAFIICVLPCSAIENEQIMLKKILINPINDNSYSINAYFTEEYKNKAFIENPSKGEYYIYLPEASLYNKNTKIIYSNNSDKKRINLLLDEKPFVDKDDISTYVRIIVSMNSDYSVRVISKTTADDKFLLFFTSVKNSAGLLIFALLLLIIGITIKTLNMAKINLRNIAHTSFPSDFKINKIQQTSKNFEKDALKKYVSQNSATNPFKVADRNSFKCFDIPETKDSKSNFNLKNSIEEIINDKLDLPFADDVIKNVKKPKQHDKDGNEILSMLNIGNNRGFYLALTDDCMSLYGFINDNIILIKKFKDLAQINLQARYYDESAEGEVYIVRLDSYKSMIEFSNDSIRELVVL